MATTPSGPSAAIQPATPTSTSASASSSASSPRPVPPDPAELDPAELDPAELDQMLRDAVWARDLATARRLVEAGADVNAKDPTEQSAYLIATSEAGPEFVRLMLAHGARVNDKDSFNGTGLIRAAERGYAHNVGLLLQAGIDQDHVNRLGWQAIHEAVWLGSDEDGHVDTVLALIAGGVQLDRPAVVQQITPLQMAEQRRHQRQAAALRAAREPVATAQADATLLRAAEQGDAVLAARALRAGADLETRDEARRTPLLLAATGDHLEVARLLVHLGADPDALDSRHDTPWLVTGVTGSVAMGRILLAAEPDLTIRNRFGGISVIPAADRGHLEYVRWVVSATDIDVDHVNDLGWTALLEAVLLGDGSSRYVQIVQTLIEAGADPSIPDKDGVTALEHARRLGHTEIERALRGR